MKERIFLLILIGVSLVSNAQAIKVVKIDALEETYTRPNDTTYVVNFFATWCGPCMKEIPVFNAFNERHKNSQIQLLFVSLDNPAAPKKLATAVKKAGMQAPVLLLDESNDFAWLPKLDKRWQGSIPATMIINSKKRINVFLETPMEEGDLEKYLSNLGL
jgi:thiol-disulfide isomerase/thioredoxin